MHRAATLTLLVLAVAAAPRAQEVPAGDAAARMEPAMVNCPSVVGDGVYTERIYCDVPIGTDAEQGILVAFPPHVGPVTLRFDLHNRHVYSAEEVKARKAFSRYTARIGVLTLDNHVIAQAAIRSEFRTEADLFDRISGGGGAIGLKAVAPTGVEAITLTIDEAEQGVSILGEQLEVERSQGVDTFRSPGRPAALISNVRVQYVPAPGSVSDAR